MLCIPTNSILLHRLSGKTQTLFDVDVVLARVFPSIKGKRKKCWRATARGCSASSTSNAKAWRCSLARWLWAWNEHNDAWRQSSQRRAILEPRSCSASIPIRHRAAPRDPLGAGWKLPSGKTRPTTASGTMSRSAVSRKLRLRWPPRLSQSCRPAIDWTISEKLTIA